MGLREGPQEARDRFPRSRDRPERHASTTFPDEEHSSFESRLVTLGMSSRGRILVVIHTEHGNMIRIISARRATRYERRFYEEG